MTDLLPRKKTFHSLRVALLCDYRSVNHFAKFISIFWYTSFGQIPEGKKSFDDENILSLHDKSCGYYDFHSSHDWASFFIQSHITNCSNFRFSFAFTFWIIGKVDERRFRSIFRFKCMRPMLESSVYPLGSVNVARCWSLLQFQSCIRSIRYSNGRLDLRSGILKRLRTRVGLSLLTCM